MTTTDGNVAICAGGDININAAMTLTRGTAVVTESAAADEDHHYYEVPAPRGAADSHVSLTKNEANA